MTKFVVRLAVFGAVCFWSSSASSQLLNSDSFNYNAGQLSGNNGWARSSGSATTELQVSTAGGLSYTGLAPVGSDTTNALQYNGFATSSSDGLALTGQPYATAGTSLYYSLLLKVTQIQASGGDGFNTGVNLTQGSFMAGFQTIAAATVPAVGTSAAPLLIVSGDGTQFSSTFKLGTARTATAADRQFVNQQFNVGDTVFVVGKFTIGATRAADSASLFLNPAIGGVEPAPSLTVTGGTAFTTANFGTGIQSFFVRNNTVEPDGMIIDQLRMGKTWVDVTPSATASLYFDTNSNGAGSGVTNAGSYSWDNNWSSDATGGLVTQGWTSGAKAVFSAESDATGSAYTVSISGTQSADTLTFEEGTVTITGGTLNLTGSHTVDVASGLTATIESQVDGTVGLIKSSAGTLILSGNNTYSGNLSANTGTLVLSGNNTYSGTTTIASGATLQVGNNGLTGTSPSGSAITNSGTFAINRNNLVTQSTAFGAISGAGVLVQAGAGTTTLDVANTYTGTTSATAGTLNIKHTLAVQNSVVVTDAGGSIAFDASMAGQNVTVGGLSSTGTGYTAPSTMNLTINAANAGSTYAGAITGTGTLTKKGTFPQTLSGTNTYSGATSVNVGTLQFTKKTAMPASSAIAVNGQPDWTVTSGTSTNFTGGILSVYTDDGSSGTTWSNSSTSAAGTIGGMINGIGGQGNTVVWNAGSSLGIHVESGLGDPTAGIEYSGAIGNFHTIVTPAGDFNHNNVVDAGDYVIWRKGGSPNPNSAGDYNAWRSTFGATGGGSGTTNNVGLMKRGYGTVTLSGTNTFRGQLKVNDDGGTLRLTSVQANAGQDMALPAVYIGGATATTNTILKVLTNDALPTNSLIRFGSGTTGPNQVGAILRLHEADAPNTSIPSIPAQSFNQTVRGFSGGDGRIQIGAGTLTINTPGTESNSFTGKYQTNYDAGAGASGQHGTIIKTGTGRQDFDFSDTEGNGGSTITGTIKGDFILQQGTVGIGNGQIFGLNSPVTDPTTSNALPWPRLTINGGTLMNISGSSLSMNVPNVFIGGSFTFDVVGGSNSQFSGGTNHTLTTLTASPTITVTSGTSSGTFILPWKVQDDGTARGITKAGPGVLVLSSEQNSYRGDTVIQDGSVRLSTGVITAGTVPVLGNQTTPGRLVLAGGRLEMNSNPGTTFASEFSGNPYAISNNRTNIENNPIHVEAPNDNSTIAFFAAPTSTLSAGDIYFVFQTNSFDWTSGKLTFIHNGNNFSAGNTFRLTFTGNFNYAGPVAISNNTGNAGKTVLQSANISGTQTWSNDISGNGSFLRDGAGGTTVLSGNNTYTGDTTVNGGILSITHAYLADAADVYLSHLTDSNAKLDLNFVGTDTIDQLFFNGVATLLTGTWGSSALGATHQDDSFFSGTGMLMISTAGGAGSNLTNGTSAVPEPAALSLVLLAIGPAMAFRRRNR